MLQIHRWSMNTFTIQSKMMQRSVQIYWMSLNIQIIIYYTHQINSNISKNDNELARLNSIVWSPLFNT